MKFLIRIPADLSKIGIQYPIKTEDTAVDRMLIMLSFETEALLNVYRPVYSLGLLKELTGVKVPYYLYYIESDPVSGRKLTLHDLVEFGSTVIHPESSEMLIEVSYSEPVIYPFPLDIDVNYVECKTLENKVSICFGVGSKTNQQDRENSRIIIHGPDYAVDYNVKRLKEIIDTHRQVNPFNLGE